MARLMEVIQRESCFQPGSSLCTGCMESIGFQNIGKMTDNGKKTIFTLGTFCGEVSTLQFPGVVAWGRQKQSPEDWKKSFGVIHHVFESAPSVAEGVRDTADLLMEMKALSGDLQVVSLSGDGGALAIGLRTLLSTIHRGSRITIFVMINEIFANTGFQYSPATSLGSETSTTPVGNGVDGNPMEPIDHLSLAVAAGAGFVAQASPAFPKFFYNAVEKALDHSGTSVFFIPSPCITGWKYPEGKTMELARLACETGFFPCFIKSRQEAAQLKFVEIDPAKRPPVEDFMGPQRRFHHLVAKDPVSGSFKARPQKEAMVQQIRDWIQRRLLLWSRL